MNNLKIKKLILTTLFFFSSALYGGDQACNECCNFCKNGYFIAEYLFWQPWQDGIDIAGKGSLYPGDIKQVEFDGAHGFRLAAGGYFYDDWMIQTSYTYLRPDGSTKLSDDEIFPTFIPQFTAGGWSQLPRPPFFNLSLDTAEAIFNHADVSIKLDYNLIDVDLKKRFCCSPCFYFELGTGAQGAFIKERFSGTYSGNLVAMLDQFTETITEISPYIIDFEQKWEFNGGGLKLGAGGEYQNSCGFLIRSSGYAAVLFGKYENRYERNPVFTDHPSADFGTLFLEYYHISGDEDFNDFVSNFDFDFAIGWEYCSFRFTVGYEVTYWLDLAQFRKGLTGLATETGTLPPPVLSDFHFAPTNVTSKVGRNIGFHGLVVHAEYAF